MTRRKTPRQQNAKRRCGNCRFWFPVGDDMWPEADRHKQPGQCGNEHVPSCNGWRFPRHGQQCSGFSERRNSAAER